MKTKTQTNVLISYEEHRILKELFFPGRRGGLSHSKLKRFIDKNMPPHIRRENWESFGYLTRAKLIKDWELKQLRAQQQELFDRLKREAEGGV